MRFQTPQFIEVEDKIFGPFTFKQMIYIAGSVGIAFIMWTFLPKFLSKPITLLLVAPIIALGVALAFYKINNRPFIEILEAAFSYIISTRLYIWKKNQKEKKKGEEKRKKDADDIVSYVPKLSESKLKDLAWSLDIQESIYSKEEQRR